MAATWLPLLPLAAALLVPPPVQARPQPPWTDTTAFPAAWFGANVSG